MIELKTDVLRVKNADGEWETIPALSPEIPVKSVSTGGTAIEPDENGNVNVPVATNTVCGVSMPAAQYGTAIVTGGKSAVYCARESDINARTSAFRPIVPSNLNASVKASLTDSKRIGYNGDAELTSAEMDNACAVLGAVRDECMQLVETIVLDGTETTLSRNWNLKAMRIATENVLPSDATANRVFKVLCKSGSTVLPTTYYDSWKVSGYIIYDVYPRYGFWCSERTATASAGAYNAGSANSTYVQRMQTVANCPYITTQEISFSVPPISGGKIHIYGVLV